MLWRAWCFLCGLPLGALAAWAWLGPRTPASVPALGALAGGIALLGAASWIARLRPAHGAQLALAACVSVAAWPALTAVWLALPPGPAALALALCAAQTFALARTARADAVPGAGARLPRAVVVSLACGSVASLAASTLAGLVAGSGATHAPGRADAIYDIDATVAMRPLPVCGSRPAQLEVLLEVLLERGAHPQLSPDGEHLWFDAPDDTGARQIQRLRLSDPEVTCWTCGETGDNRRPRPGASGVVFESDRHADWRAPSNTEIHWIEARGDTPRQPSRRLTHSPGPDTHPIFAPGGPRVVWSRLRAGYEIVSAPLQRAHGGVAFGADGTFALAVEARRARAAGLLPAAFAAPFASLATRAQTAPLYRETRLRAGERGTPLQPVAVPDLELWGEPTGAALAPDGQSAFLGQRRADGAERLVRLHLGCR